MILLTFIAIGSAFNLQIPDHYLIEFEADCQEFFVLKGGEDYAYFHRNNVSLELWLTRNQSYEIYTADFKDKITFEWPAKLINSLPMELALFDGVISQPYQFDTSKLLCKTLGYADGSLVPLIAEKEPVYKCEYLPDHKLKYAVVILAIVLVGSILVHADESVRAVFRSEVPGVLQWGAAFLSGRQEHQYERYRETSI